MLFRSLQQEFVVDWVERTVHTCPVETSGVPCGSLDISEYVEPPEDITALVSVPHSEVNSYLAKDYKVKSIYVKETVMTKTSEAKKP